MANNSLDKAREIINEVDRKMAELFVKRMQAVRAIGEYKKKNGLAILDKERQAEVIKRNSTLIEEESIRKYYLSFLEKTMSLSREYQSEIFTDKPSINGEKRIHINLGGGYDVSVGRGLLSRAGELFNLNRRVLIVTDSGVPSEYARAVEAVCKEARIVTLPEGEGSKNMDCFALLCREMLDFKMTRTDCVVAVGGGVVGDISGFAAASFMRGIDFYNIPTTLLSQVDSSIGGKTAINLSGVKNIVGAFYQPKGVICDLDTLRTLPKRQIANGLSEAIKMALTSDEELFSLFEEKEITEDILEKIVTRSINIKSRVVEEDEREGGIRRILNFGHTLGHGIEAAEEGRLYHGECVALGMMAVCSEEIKKRLIPVLRKAGLPTGYDGDINKALSFISHDKKCDGGLISVVLVDRVGSYRIEKMDTASFKALVLEERV